MSPRSIIAEPHPDPELTRAEDLHRRAVAENAAGRAARGASLARTGLETLGAPGPPDPQETDPSRDRSRLVSRLHATLAKSLVETRGVPQALEAMDRSLAWADRVDEAELTAFLVSQRGLIHFRGGRFAAAEADFDRAISMMASAETPPGVDLVRVLLNRGALHVEAGDVARARSDLDRALALAREIGFTQAERIVLHNLGCLEFTAGDLPRALRLMQDGADLDKAMGASTLQGVAHLDRSRVLLAAGLPAEADEALEQAATHLRRDRCWQDLGEVDLTRAEVALLTGRTADARTLAARARNRFRRHGNERWRRAADLMLLSADQAAGRPPARLLAPALRLADGFGEAGFELQRRTALLLAAELSLDLDRTDEATELLASAGPATARDPISVRLHTRLVEAEAHRHRREIPSARRALARGVEDLASYQAQFGGIDLQTSSAVHGRRLAARDLRLALDSGQPSALLAAVERSRAVTGRIRSVTPPADEHTAELLARLRMAADADAAASGVRAQSATAARREIAQLQAELRSRSWLNQGSRAWRRPVGVSELRTAAADAGADLVTITETGSELWAVTITADGRMRRSRLGDPDLVRGRQRRLAADLDVLADVSLPASLRARVAASLRGAAADLGELLAPAFDTCDHPGRRPVVISPPGHLLSLPWPLVQGPAGRPVTVTPSLSGWQRARSGLAEAGPNGWSVATVAGPKLRRAASEAAAVARTWAARADARDLGDAGAGEVLEAMGTCRIAHVAAHGVHQAENPMFSSLSLTGGPLFAYELDRGDAVPEHVVLSACEAGRSTARAGDESLGLTSVLLQVGTACVVAGVARVDDDLAADLMERYHAELVRGADSAEALCLVADQVPTPSPFVCFGAAWRG